MICSIHLTILLIIEIEMARGWESKSVESQVESARNEDDGHGSSEPVGRSNTAAEKAAAHERQSLLLSRAYVLHRIEASTNERYTESLRQALNEIEQKLAHLTEGK